MAGFRVLAAKQALCDMTAAKRPAAAVRPGLPTESELPNTEERIYFTTVRALTRPTVTEQRVRLEEYDVTVIVDVVLADADGRDDAEGRLWQVLSDIDDAIEADDELGGAVTGCALTSVDEQHANPLPDGGWLATASGRVRVQQMI